MYIIRILHPYIVDIPHVDRTLGMHLAPDISIGTLANAVRPDDIEPEEVTELTWNPWDITATIVNEYIYIYIIIITMIIIPLITINMYI